MGFLVTRLGLPAVTGGAGSGVQLLVRLLQPALLPALLPVVPVLRFANNLTLVQRTLHLRSQLTGDAQGCGHGDSYQKIVEDLKIKTSQSIHSQAAEVTRMVKVTFPTLANTDRRAMALEYFTRAWEGKNIQRHLLVVAAATIKKTVHASEEYVDVSESEQTLRAMPVEQMGLPAQPSALEVGLKVMTQQTALIQQVLKKIRQPSTRQQKNCFRRIR